ncbi:MAG: cell division protein FtsZ [Bacteroidetes bacterium]|nr:cell division protein FtsZ [Bacteroidota bacterium]
MGIDFNLPEAEDSGLDFNLPLAQPAAPQADAAYGLEPLGGGAEDHLIKVIGVGGGGGNAVRNMFEKGIHGVDFYICNTDAQVLRNSPIPYKLQLGESLTHGLGCGAKPEVGREAAIESREDILSIFTPETRMVFITAGMGGGTGTGAAPVIAEVARERGILTVGIVTTPFKFEGEWRARIARQGVAELERCVDTLVVINNANLSHICPRNAKARDAYKMADEVLCNAAKGIAELITKEGYINLDFADVQTIMKDGGTALMGMATFAGEGRAIMAVEEALSSPLLDNIDIHGATGVLVNITASEDTLTMDEVETIGEYVKEAVGEHARIITGQVLTDEAGDSLTVTVIATGFGKPQAARPAMPAATTQQQPHPQVPPQPQPPVARRQDAPIIPQRKPQAVNRPRPQQPAERLPVGEPLDLFSNAAAAGESAAQEGFYQPTQVPQQQQQPPQPRRIRTHMDIHNPEHVENMERVPSYLRREVNIEAEPPTRGGKLSRLSIHEEGEESYRLRDNNSFLFDNVD